MVTLGQLETFFIMFYLRQGSFETTFLPSQGRDRVCVHLTFPRWPDHTCVIAMGILLLFFYFQIYLISKVWLTFYFLPSKKVGIGFMYT